MNWIYFVKCMCGKANSRFCYSSVGHFTATFSLLYICCDALYLNRKKKFHFPLDKFIAGCYQSTFEWYEEQQQQITAFEWTHWIRKKLERKKNYFNFHVEFVECVCVCEFHLKMDVKSSTNFTFIHSLSLSRAFA